MSDVKRYRWPPPNMSEFNIASVDYVVASDHDRVVAELATARAQIAKLREQRDEATRIACACEDVSSKPTIKAYDAEVAVLEIRAIKGEARNASEDE